MTHGNPFPQQLGVSGDAHVAVLVFLAAAARAGVVAAHFGILVANRFLLLFRSGVGRGLLLVVGGAGRVGFVNGRSDRPDRFLEAFRLFHTKDRVGYAVFQRFLHQVEFLHALALVNDLRVFLGDAAKADRRT